MDTPTANASEQLAWLMDSWKTIEMITFDKMINRRASSDNALFPSTRTTNRYIETSSGQRVYEEHTVPENGTEITNKYYTDGMQAAAIYRGSPRGREVEQVTIRRSFGLDDQGWHHCPDPLKYFYAGLLPLHEAIGGAEYLGTSRHLDRDCDVFLIDRSRVKSGLDTVYHLDRATSVPLKVYQYNDEHDRVDERPVVVWAATSLDEVDGRPFPLRSEQHVYSAAEPGKPYLEVEIVVESLKFDETYPSSTFQPVYSPQASVINEITGTFIPPREQATDVKGQVSASPPIRAVSNRSWADSAPTLILAIGLLILMTSLLLWWRRH